MNKTIPDILNLLESLNNKLKVKLLSEKAKIELQEEIKEFEEDLMKLQKTINSIKKATQRNDYEKIIADLYEHLGRIIQDLENIHEITTSIAQRYAKEFLNDK